MDELVIEIRNEKDEILRILIEPIPEYYTIHPGESVEVHAVMSEGMGNRQFSIAPGKDLLIVYAPGLLPNFAECYVTKSGVRCAPEDE